MIPMRAAAATLALFCTVTLMPQAGAQDAARSFGRLQDAIGKSMAELPEDERITKIFEDAVALQAASSRLSPDDIGDYVRSLDHDTQLLEAALDSSGPERDAILADVAEDLEIKRSAGNGMGAGSSFPGRVSIRVTTRRGVDAVPGYVIGLNPMRWRGQQPMFRLPILSPASGSVPPGRYEVIALRDGRPVARDIVRIGLAAEDTMEIDLPVP